MDKNVHIVGDITIAVAMSKDVYGNSAEGGELPPLGDNAIAEGVACLGGRLEIVGAHIVIRLV